MLKMLTFGIIDWVLSDNIKNNIQEAWKTALRVFIVLSGTLLFIWVLGCFLLWKILLFTPFFWRASLVTSIILSIIITAIITTLADK